jgi:hypothetical protein
VQNFFSSGGPESEFGPQRKSRPRVPRAPISSRPTVECLEDRLVPATIFVHNTADGSSSSFAGNTAPNLRSAIDFSNAGDVIALDTKTYVVTGEFGELFVQHDLTIKNNAGGISTIQADSQDPTRVFEIGGGEGSPNVVTMTGLKITGGNGSGSGQGGGILIDANAQLTMNNDTVTANSVTGSPAQGGGIANFGVLTLNQCMISLNTAEGQVDGSGFGGGVFQGSGAGNLTIINSTFSQNTADSTASRGRAEGGGLYVDANSAQLSISGSTFTGNTAQGSLFTGLAEGGGLFEESNSHASIANSTFKGNAALGGGEGGDAHGGGVYFNSELSDLSVSASTFANNRAVGGDENLQGGSLPSSGGAGEGGGLYQGNEGGSISIVRSTFSGNQAVGGNSSGGGGAGQGGGLYQENGAGNLSVLNSTFGGNTTRGGTGTLLPGVLPLAQIRPQGQGGVGGVSSGGGLYLAGSGTDQLVNDTIARNSAFVAVGGGPAATGGGLSSQGSSGSNHAQVWNTLIALNSAPSGPDVFGTVVTLGHNLVGNTSGSSGFSAAKHDLLNVSAAKIGLGQLADNGGPTQTMALLPGSIAIDAGDDAVMTDSRTKLTTDQRGLPRKSGAHVDIGAFEFQVVPRRRGRRNGPPY